MTEPTTTVNALFSAPGAMATSWDDARRSLETAELFWITTVRADGRPHLTPLVAVWLDDVLHFCTGETEQKEVNLRVNEHVILMTGCNQWDGGMDVVVEGRAIRITDQRTLERLAEVWTHKWDGRWNYEPGPEGFTGDGNRRVRVFAVRPDKVLAFAKGDFSQTRHTF
jgi:general stress protein 26